MSQLILILSSIMNLLAEILRRYKTTERTKTEQEIQENPSEFFKKGNRSSGTGDDPSLLDDSKD